ALISLLEAYYPVEGDEKKASLGYDHFSNRMAFWMATGSGKTLVIVKLVELLKLLMERGEVPRNDILVLAHRDDLLEQLRSHVEEFNTIGDLNIILHELKDYSEVKHALPRLFSGTECHIFYYRSDNLSDEQKEKIIDFRSYDNNGHWYVLLDEAHKGDKEDSKRQQIYSIMSRNGFLFNFSATFTDPRDIITTAFDFNLSKFIQAGFGKHIYIFEEDTKAFRKKEDFTDNQKQKIVLKALIMLTLARQQEERVRAVDTRLYHRPLLMTLVNSVNTKDADLKMFFRELALIGKGQIDESQWQNAKSELRDELGQHPTYMYEANTPVRIADRELESVSQADLRKAVFNCDLSGEIEVLIRPSDRQEVALKLKTSDEPFALIRIGDISKWLTEEFTGYEINQHFNEESFFERLNKDGSDINMLLGSRSFYEGWDSNRPNVIMYINIGVGFDAKKFILQSVGRGARIEPVKDKRKRFAYLKTGGLLTTEEEALFEQVKNDVLILESEFIFGTNSEALTAVIENLEQEDEELGSQEISLEVNWQEVKGKTLLVPVYRMQDQPLAEKKKSMAKFSLSAQNLAVFEKYMQYLDDDRVLLAMYNAQPNQVSLLRKNLEDTSEHFRTEGPNYTNLEVLLGQALRFSTLYGKQFHEFKLLEDEINHYRRVRLVLPKIEFERFESQLQTFKEKPRKVAELRAKYDTGQLSFDDLFNQSAKLSTIDIFDYKGQSVKFVNVAQHYYLPMLISEDEKIEYIRTVIKVESEVRFLDKLIRYLEEPENKFGKMDWWLFSRVDETYDQVNVPYYNPFENKVLNFKPDFIFWLQKGTDYHIIFVDPKGTSRTEYEHKVDGFRELFEKDGRPIVFEYDGLQVQVHLFLFTSDRAFSSDGYRRFWLDSVDGMLGM
ncbi:MAG: DEAD/DEAH box helicase family protein, partial [Anaerolineaceae bacterium]|nr:DEAD/DEAH box helicase family protein [Anaerolineaceae bacterium]